ncbi:MAG: hypothetical protein JWL69_3720 [Phycisphaerales bacterium]|nr:hypothetical protein [Phycisphaerales bacterium]MDB5354968.1 hypothetical protein [Phycisphaerales bacterium]
MRVSQIVKVRRVVAAAAITAFVFCAKARADVFEQVPADSAGVVKIKSLESLNTKVAKMAKTFGLDEISPDFKDPLASALEKGHMSKGIDKSGDAALAIFAPDKKGEGADEPQVVALIPVSDYKAFVGNFEPADGGGDGVTAVKDPNNPSATTYIAEHGKYAAMSDKKELLARKVGLKLTGAARKESDAKDVIVYVNIPAVRAKVLPELKAHRQEALDRVKQGLESNAQLKQFAPVAGVVVNQCLDFAQNFMQDAQAVVFSLNLTDEGLAGGGLVEFSEGSDLGKTVAELKPGSTPLLAGLPDRKYFAFGGSSVDPKVTSKIAAQFLDPISKELRASGGDTGKQIADAVDAVKTAASSASHTASGYVVPTGALGQESIVQTVSVVNGDSRKLSESYKTLLAATSKLMSLAPKENGTAKFEVTPNAKTIDGVKLDAFTMKMELDENDPRAAQAQQMMAMIYGPNGLGGVIGAVDDKTLILTEGATDKLIADTIASARAGKDVLSDTPGVKAVSAQLPEGRVLVYYVALDNIVTSAVKYAQGFGLQVKLKLPQNLPPLGVSASTDGPAARMDVFVPAQTVQSLVAAGIQAYTQMQNGGGAGGL